MSDPDELRARIAALEADNAALRAERDAAHAEGRFVDSLLENLPIMIFVKDAKELRFLRFNAASERVFGFPREAMLGRNDFDFFPAAEASFFTSKDREVLSNGTLLDIPEEPLHTPGGLRWLHTRKIPIHDDDGRPRYLLGISEDITEHKLAAAALAERTAELHVALNRATEADAARRDRDQQLSLVLERFPGAVWTADVDLTVVSVAGARAADLGLDPETSPGRPLLDLHPPVAGSERLRSLLARALGGDHVTYTVVGRDAVFEVRVEPRGERAEDGLIGVAFDVTARRREEDTRLREHVARTQRLETLGLLAGGIAHDFNNLLTVILGNASLALTRLEPDSAARKALGRVEHAAQHAAELTRQLLAFSGRGRVFTEALDMSTVVEAMASFTRLTVPRTCRMEVELARGLPAFDGDVQQLRQVVMNLVRNAAEAIGEREGTIRLSTGVVDADAAYLEPGWVSDAATPGRYVWLEVADDGCGIDPAHVREIFDPKYTTKHRGLGLGLSAVLGIVRAHRGAIRVDSDLGHGTSIRVLVPTTEEAATDRDVPLPGSDTPTRKPHVLVVDDEPDIREFAKDTLEEEGYDVSTAVDGVEAVERFRAEPERFDLVLLDMTMPRMNGDEAYRELCLLRPDVRVLLSSGFMEQETTARFAGRGLAGFLQKPYTARALIARVNELAGR